MIPVVKCRNCQNLEVIKDPDGLQIRCSLGFYDKPDRLGSTRLGSPCKTIPVYYSVLSLHSGNVGLWQATEKCGDKYQVATRWLNRGP